MQPGLYKADLLSGTSSYPWLTVTQANDLLHLTQSITEIFSAEQRVFTCSSSVN